MTTLSVDKARDLELGTINELPVIATDIIYEGAAVGSVKASGHCRPLAAGDRFEGFAERVSDNSLGIAAAKNVRVRRRGLVKLAVSGAVITYVGQPVYASDDDTFVFTPTSNSFIGFVHRYVSSGVVIVAYDVDNLIDPYAGKIAETVSANVTVDATDSGRIFFVNTDAKIITLPAVQGIAGFKIVNIGAYGVVAVTIAPNANDMIEGPGITAADDKDIVNTAATAQRGDYVQIEYGDANGWAITDMKGTWARET